MFEIDLTSLEPGVHHLTREVAPEELTVAVPEEAPGSADTGEESQRAPAGAGEEVDFGPVQVDAVVDYDPDQVLVTLHARATATMTCDRTLRRFEAPLEGSYAVLFAAPERGAPDESEDHDERRELAPGARFLDLTSILRDTLLLAVPHRKVAPGAEEEEIDTTFGSPAGEDAVDPRWEKLRRLRAQNADEASSDERNSNGSDASR